MLNLNPKAPVLPFPLSINSYIKFHSSIPKMKNLEEGVKSLLGNYWDAFFLCFIVKIPRAVTVAVIIPMVPSGLSGTTKVVPGGTSF
jgi:hypothetical protein